MTDARFIRWFHEIGVADVGLVGGKNASLGEMYQTLTSQGITFPMASPSRRTATVRSCRSATWRRRFARSSPISIRVTLPIWLSVADAYVRPCSLRHCPLICSERSMKPTCALRGIWSRDRCRGAIERHR